MAKAKSRKEELIDELLKECESPDDIVGENGLLKELTESLLSRALEGEMTHHLGYEKNSPAGNNTGNSRNGSTEKTVKTKSGEIAVKVPRDRKAEFEPQILKKYQTRFNGFDEKIISMYARGMTTRDIAAHLKEIYGVDVSAEFISQVTNSVTQEVTEWQNRPLDSIYPIVYLDAMFAKIRDEGQVKNKAVYLAVGVSVEGQKEVLGLWIQQTEGAKFWLQVLSDIKNRGVNDIFFACVDGLKGFTEAIESVFPHTVTQICVVHMIRNSLRFVTWRDRRQLTNDLKQIYRAPNEEKAHKNLEMFEQKWGGKYPSIGKLWRRNWDRISPFLDYPMEIRRVIYTTNAIESLNASLRKVTKNRGSFPSDDACAKIMYLAIKNATQKWGRPANNWGAVINRLLIQFEDRM